ncbi:esterase-like activity of phytase family protein [Candidatus Methylocalor cossyra]|uniref:esterase-like activity of phytase family protein n=1 Tax=Candidatus Methylocalor cossyra TaxID=3108543 RepID=UPI0032B15667
MRQNLLGLAIVSSCFAIPTTVHATPILLAIGSLTGSSAGANADLSGLTYPLENGVPANLLGGLGSALAYAGNGLFIATPDRGPNALTFNPLVDNTVSYINRFQTLTMTLAPHPGPGLPYTLTPTLTGSTLLWNPTPLYYGDGSLGTDGSHTLGSGVPAANTGDAYYFTGRSDGFGPGPSSNPADARFDPEGVRVSADGKSVFISDEYGPFIYQFDRATGQRLRSFTLPAHLAVAHPGPTTAAESKPANSSGRVPNKGMEGLAITPDGKTLVGILQAPLLQDKNDYLRLVSLDIATGATREYAYPLTAGSGVSEIVAINDHQFLVDERDGKGLGDGTNARVKDVFRIDLQGATDVSGIATLKDGAGFVPVAKSEVPLFNLVNLLETVGIGPDQVPAKIEGLAFGPDLVDPHLGLLHTLFIANDNDFVPSAAYADPGAPVAGPNLFYVVGLSDSDLPGFQNQRIPVPGTPWLVAAGLGFGLRYRRTSRPG